MQWAQNKKGFTIVELLIVIVVIAILAAITIVAYNGIQETAKSAAFTGSLDSLEKKILLQKAETGVFSSNLFPEQEVTNSIGQGRLIQNSCAPGNYPETDIFEEGECFTLIQTVTYDGDSSPAYETRWSFFENANYIEEYESSGLGRLGELPGDNGFSIDYTVRQQVTAANATTSGYSNPRDGWISIHSVQARRGATISATRVAGAVTTVGVTYFLKGDQVCGRGVKALVAYGDEVQAIIENAGAGSFVGAVPEELTQCSLTLR